MFVSVSMCVHSTVHMPPIAGLLHRLTALWCHTSCTVKLCGPAKCHHTSYCPHKGRLVSTDNNSLTALEQQALYWKVIALNHQINSQRESQFLHSCEVFHTQLPKWSCSSDRAIKQYNCRKVKTLNFIVLPLM